MGDGTWADWYKRTMCGAEGGISEPQGPPYPIGTVQARWEAIGQIYDRVDGKDPPSCNIASEALRAYYSGVTNTEDMGMPDTLHDFRVSHGLHDQGFPGHQSDIAWGT